MDPRVLAGGRDVKDNAPEDGRAKCDMNEKCRNSKELRRAGFLLVWPIRRFQTLAD